MKTINSIIDLVPLKGAVEVKELPKGKPLHRTVVTNGAYRQVTYVFKQGVYLVNHFRGKKQVFMRRPEIVSGKGDFLR